MDPGIFEDAGNRVVVLLGNRIEFVVVAAGALHGQSEKGPGEGVDAVSQCLGFGLGLRLRVASIGFLIGPDGEEARSIKRERFIDQVAGDLVFDELVIGQVAVEAIHHPVPVAPGSR